MTQMRAKPTTNRVELEGYAIRAPTFRQLREDTFRFEVFIETHEVDTLKGKTIFRQELHRATAWGQLAVEASKLAIRRNDRVRVVGKLQTRRSKKNGKTYIFTGVWVQSIEVTERGAR